MTKHLNKRQLKAISALILGLIGLTAQHFGWLQPIKQIAVVNQPGLYRVSEYIDGDTIVVDMNGSDEKLRFIGVDTPETHDPRKAVQCYGQAAAGFTKNIIPLGGVVGTSFALKYALDNISKKPIYVLPKTEIPILPKIYNNPVLPKISDSNVYTKSDYYNLISKNPKLSLALGASVLAAGAGSYYYNKKSGGSGKGNPPGPGVTTTQPITPDKNDVDDVLKQPGDDPSGGG